jgi:hypothetical protein
MSEQGFFVPVVAPMLLNRKFMLVISGAAALQIGLTRLKLSGMPCPLLKLTGIPCPGCGLTRSIIFLFQGDWQRSLTFHAFAPVIVAGLCLVAIAAVLPQRPRKKFVNVLDQFERHTGISAILLVGLIVYWLARLLIMQSAFVNLIRG